MSANQKTNLEWILSAYGHCIPRNARIAGKQFSALIKAVYCQSNEANSHAANLAEKYAGNFENLNGVSFRYICEGKANQ